LKKDKKSKVKKEKPDEGEDSLDGKALHDLYRHTTKLIK